MCVAGVLFFMCFYVDAIPLGVTCNCSDDRAHWGRRDTISQADRNYIYSVAQFLPTQSSSTNETYFNVNYALSLRIAVAFVDMATTPLLIVLVAVIYSAVPAQPQQCAQLPGIYFTNVPIAVYNGQGVHGDTHRPFANNCANDTAGPAQNFVACCEACHQNTQCGCFNFFPGLCIQAGLCTRLAAIPTALGGLKNNDAAPPDLPSNAACTVYEGRSWGNWGLTLGWIVVPTSM